MMLWCIAWWWTLAVVQLSCATTLKSSLADASLFHHVEFLCGDATQLRHRLASGLGLEATAVSDLSTKNANSVSYCLRSSEARVICTAPQSRAIRESMRNSNSHLLFFEPAAAEQFVQRHGIAVKAIGLKVSDVHKCFERAVRRGAIGEVPPTTLRDKRGSVDIAEVRLYGDVTLRLIDDANFCGEFLPTYDDLKGISRPRYGRFGIERFDHVVGNVWKLADVTQQIKRFTDFHEFAEFSAADVGTEESGLNSVVLANNQNTVLLPLNEPTYGTARRSQIETYLNMNDGPGVQHIALQTADIISTVRDIRAAAMFEFMPPPPRTYYARMRRRLAGKLDSSCFSELEALGILADSDGEGILLQIFTKPISDKPTFFFELIQRIGCKTRDGTQKPGCGGFGKGNFKELFKSVEEYEESLLEKR